MSWLNKLKKNGKQAAGEPNADMPTGSNPAADVIERSVNFEITREHAIRQSERRAWMVAASSCTLALVLAAGYFFVMPLKEKVPYIVSVDSNSGVSIVAKLSDTFDNMTVSSRDALNKANITNFITAYEAYDWDLWNKRDGYIVYSMAEGGVLKAYQELYADKFISPDVIFGRKKVRRVKIKSLVLTDKNAKGIPTGATISFERIVIDKAYETAMFAETLVATMAFEYASNLEMKEEMRIHNPLGFRVTAYRVDPEATSSTSRDLILRELSNAAVGQQLKAPTVATPQPRN
jgi:type IV secretion system protein VirB8